MNDGKPQPPALPLNEPQPSSTRAGTTKGGASRPRVLLTDRAWPDAQIERVLLAEAGAELVEAPATDEATLVSQAAGVQAIITNWANVTAAVIESASHCRVICRAGIGLDNIDVAAASARGILVTNVPDYCVTEVADHALALLLACARNVALFHRRTKQGEYRLQAAPPMLRLTGKVLGLIGLGRIGSSLAERVRPLGLRIVACTSSGSAHGVECEMASLDELLGQSDFVSLHAPLTPATRYLLRLPQFEKMKRSAYVINTSRGGLIDHADLQTALARNLIAGAALDVFEPEPPDLSQPLFLDERVIVTPHAAFVSQESLVELRTRVARQVVAVLQGRRPENIVNAAAVAGS
ncbi:MAG: C-terminal binding protein [Planctomycetaceae bacterium]|nr:C-terminal binding protein [Planctomycetaceae bacterium]